MVDSTNKSGNSNRRLRGNCSKTTKRRIRRQVVKNLQIVKNSVVTNLSSYKLSLSDITALNKGLGFVPSTNRLRTEELDRDIKRFERRLQIHYHFKSKDGESCDLLDNFSNDSMRPKSTWWPKKLNAHITTFCDSLKENISKLAKGSIQPNLTGKELNSLCKFKNNTDLIIKPADKGGGIAVMNKVDYVNKVNAMLDDHNVYCAVDVDNTCVVKQKADNLLLLLHQEGYITDKQLKFLTDFEPRMPVFYGLPKLHKKDIPLRPVVSQTNGPTNMVNYLVDKLLTVAEKCIPNLLQDTTAFLNIIEANKGISDGDLLVTMDVTSLYTNIPQDEGIEWVCEFYQETLPNWNQYSTEIKAITVEELAVLMKFILHNCTFEFNGKLYKQNYGTTMGARFSVKYANIYMHKFFTKFLARYQLDKPDFLSRLIDDVFTIWRHGKETLDVFIKYLNSVHGTIKFTAEYSDKEVHFLDTVVYINGGLLHTKVYTKPTDKKQFLYYSSCHPRHVLKAIPYSQALRYRRNTSDDFIFKESLQTLRQQFLNRGYPPSLLDKELDKVTKVDRYDTLQYVSAVLKRAKFEEMLQGRTFLPLIITYFDQFRYRRVNKLINKLWPSFIDSSDKIKEIFATEFPMIVYKKGKSLGNRLVRAKLPVVNDDYDDNLIILMELLIENTNCNDNIDFATVSPKISACGKSRCKCCTVIKQDSYFTDKSGSKVFPINSNMNCDSSDVIYLINCTKCKLQYVGQTSMALKDRLNCHRSDIKCFKNTSVGVHFSHNRHCFRDLRIMPIESVVGLNKKERDTKEYNWMSTLNTFYPEGLNFYPLETFLTYYQLMQGH